MKINHLLYLLLILFLVFFTSSVVGERIDHGSINHKNSISSHLQANTVAVAPADTVEVKSEGADLSYDVTKISAKAGSEITIKYINLSDMPHNIVLVKTESDIQQVGIAALQASGTEYIPQDMEDRILAHTQLILPGETGFVTFKVPEPGTYPYICTYAGHFTMMQGRLISTE